MHVLREGKEQNFGVLEIQDAEARIFLYKRGEVQYAGTLNLGTGKFKTTMAALAKESAAVGNPKVATAQRTAALKKVRALK